MADRRTPDFATIPLQSEGAPATREGWLELAETALGIPLETVVWNTPEGIEVDPIYDN